MPAIATEYSHVMNWPSYRASADLFEEKEKQTDYVDTEVGVDVSLT